MQQTDIRSNRVAGQILKDGEVCDVVVQAESWHEAQAKVNDMLQARGAVPRGHRLYTDAESTINGERQDQYGDPEDSFGMIARRWSEYLTAQGHGVELSAADVAFMMMDLKMARQCVQGKRDNLIDLCGYAGILDDMTRTEDKIDG